jgi:hypothetical protein
VLHGRLNVTEGGLSNSFPAIMLSTPLKGHTFMSSICVDTKTDYPFFFVVSLCKESCNMGGPHTGVVAHTKSNKCLCLTNLLAPIRVFPCGKDWSRRSSCTLYSFLSTKVTLPYSTPILLPYRKCHAGTTQQLGLQERASRGPYRIIAS